MYFGEIEGQVFNCVSYSFKKNANKYYFLFRDDSLHSIHEGFGFSRGGVIRFELYGGVDSNAVNERWDAEDKILVLAGSEGLTIEQLYTDLEIYGKIKGDLGLWPIALALAPFVPFVPFAAAADHIESMGNDGWVIAVHEIKLGMTEDEVIDILDDPLFQAKKGAVNTFAYGPGEFETVRDNYDQRTLWISIIFASGKVVAVTGDDIFDATEVSMKFFEF
jgi:hypothetical protein